MGEVHIKVGKKKYSSETYQTFRYLHFVYMDLIKVSERERDMKKRISNFSEIQLGLHVNISDVVEALNVII